MRASAIALVCTRTLSLLYICFTSYRVWRPPASLTGDDREPQVAGAAAAQGGLESLISPAAFRIGFYTSLLGQAIFDVVIFQVWGEGWSSSIKERWTLGDLMALLAMDISMRLRVASFKALGRFFTYKCVTMTLPCE